MGTPKIDTIKVVIIPEQQTAIAGLRTGEVSVMAGEVPAKHAASLRKQPGVRIVEGTKFSSALLAFNNRREPFDDAKVRTAISRAIDTEQLLNTVEQGKGVVGSPGWQHPDSPSADTSLKHVYDPGQAKALLDKIGAKPGPGGVRELNSKAMRFSLLTYSTDPQGVRAAELIRDMLKKIGIAVTVKSLDFDSLDAKVWPGYDVSRRRDYDMTMWNWSAPVQLSSLSFTSLVDSDPKTGSLNITGTKDPEIDRLADDVRAATTIEKRRQLIGKLQRRIAEITPFVTLYYPSGIHGYRKDVFDGWVYQDGRGILNKDSFVRLKR